MSASGGKADISRSAPKSVEPGEKGRGVFAAARPQGWERQSTTTEPTAPEGNRQCSKPVHEGPVHPAVQCNYNYSAWLLRIELACECAGQSFVREAPPDASSVAAGAPLATRRLNTVARVEVVHGIEPRPQAAWRYDHIHKMGELSLNSSSALAAFVTTHVCTQQS